MQREKAKDCPQMTMDVDITPKEKKKKSKKEKDIGDMQVSLLHWNIGTFFESMIMCLNSESQLRQFLTSKCSP